jgi:hypothetical protein
MIDGVRARGTGGRPRRAARLAKSPTSRASASKEGLVHALCLESFDRQRQAPEAGTWPAARRGS